MRAGWVGDCAHLAEEIEQTNAPLLLLALQHIASLVIVDYTRHQAAPPYCTCSDMGKTEKFGRCCALKERGAVAM